MFYSQVLPEKVLEQLKEYGILKDNDKVVAFYDNTMFLSGKKGLLFTDKSLIIYNRDKIVYNFDINEIKDILFTEVDKIKYIYKMELVKKNNEAIDITPSGIPNDEMKLLIDVINMYRNKKEK